MTRQSTRISLSEGCLRATYDGGVARTREQNMQRMRQVRAAARPAAAAIEMSAAVELELAGLPAGTLDGRPVAVASARRLASQLDGDLSSPRVALWLRELLTVLDELRALAPAPGGRLEELRARAAAARR